MNAAPRLRVPRLCVLCRRWATDSLCEDCVARHRHERTRCARCALATGTALPMCGQCLADPPPFTRTTVCVSYEFPWNDLVARFKFGAQVELATSIAAWMARAWHHAGPQPEGVLVAVPASPDRMRERGYNQAWELTRRIARRTGAKAHAEGLQRIAELPHQIDLGREQRRANLRAAFVVPQAMRAQLAERNLTLVDDVMTTGATVREAAATLLRAGAASVEVLAFARTDTADAP